MADRVGQQIGNYRLVRLLGHGGFAEVYLGQHIRLNLQAAIKVLHTQIATDDAESFHREAEIIASLAHRHIVRILDFDLVDGIPFLIMDYAPNGSLRQLHRRGTKVALPTIVSYVEQVASALQYSHQQKLIHRDVKPENILLGRNREILLSDFGIALIAQTSRSSAPQTASGTINYMAPEQIQGKPRFASDQYSLAVITYEWLCGHSPFAGSFTEIATQHIFTPPPPLHEKVPGMSPVVEEVIMTALAKDPQKRFASVQAFATALKQAAETAQIQYFSAPGNTGQNTLLSPSAQDVSPFVKPPPVSNPPVQLPVMTPPPDLPLSFMTPPVNQAGQTDAPVTPVSPLTPVPPALDNQTQLSLPDQSLQSTGREISSTATKAHFPSTKGMYVLFAGLIVFFLIGGYTVLAVMGRSHTPSLSPSPSPHPVSTATPLTKPTSVATPTSKHTPTPKATARPVAAPTPTPTPVPLINPSPTPTPTPNAVPTSQPTATPTATSEPTPTPTPTAAPSPTPTPTPASSPTPTPTPTTAPSPTSTSTTSPDTTTTPTSSTSP